MPRRVRVDLADVAAWDNLEAALWAAARGKRARPDVAAFLASAVQSGSPTGHAAPDLAAIQSALLRGKLPIGRLRCFAIRDPKPRIIHAAAFPDRVAHHALMRLLEPRLEQALVPSSYACRPGKGAHAAVLEARTQARRWPWVLKLDVEHCFPNIPHDRLLALLARRFKGSAQELARNIISGFEAAPGRGLPIGSLTSQHFANQYLGEADRHALSCPECLAHIRYMDDFLLFCAGKEAAMHLYRSMAEFCGDQLGLRLKQPCLLPTSAGLGFLGLRVYPGTIRLGRRRMKSWRRHRANWEGLWWRGEIGDAELQRAYASLHALTLPADSRGFRRADLARRLAPGMREAP